MDTVNRVVESASQAIWGEQNKDSSQATASNSQNKGMTGIESVDRVVNAGKKAIWGQSGAEEKGDQSSIPHGEEPVAGKRGLGTATDPYDAGNRDEQPGAPSVEAGGLSAVEQRNVEATSSSNMKNMSSGSATGAAAAAAAPDLKTTVTGLRPDPSQPGNAGPGQSLKHTSEPLEEEAQKLAKDLQDVNVNNAPTTTTTAAAAAAAPTVAGGTAVNGKNNETTKAAKDDGLSSSSSSSSSSAGHDEKQSGPKRKSSKLEKVKNKLHIGSHSPKASR